LSAAAGCGLGREGHGGCEDEELERNRTNTRGNGKIASAAIGSKKNEESFGENLGVT
jgi:hypothetical protein